MVLDRLQARKEALSNQWLPLARLREIQFAKARSLLAYSYENVPFHRKRFDRAGFRPDSFGSLADLKKLPTMSKDDLRKTPPGELTAGVRSQDSLRWAATSGTTGTPVKVALDGRELLWRRACMERTGDALGYDPWDHAAVLHFMYPKIDRSKAKSRERFKEWAFRRRMRYSRPFYFTYDCGEILGDLLKFRPKVVDGAPAYLKNLADSLRKAGKLLSLKLLSSSGDILDPGTRRYLEGYFGCPVYDIYGTRDAGPMAWQCREKGLYHLNIDNKIIEVLDEKGEDCAAGEAGRLVVTTLENYSMPLLRYEMGDVVVPDDGVCACGRTLPLIRSIEGRASEFLTLPSGRRISPREIVTAIGEVPDLPVNQLVRDEHGGLTLRLYGEVAPERAREAVAACEVLFDHEVAVTAVTVSEEPRAKLRRVIP